MLALACKKERETGVLGGFFAEGVDAVEVLFMDENGAVGLQISAGMLGGIGAVARVGREAARFNSAMSKGETFGATLCCDCRAITCSDLGEWVG